MTNLRAVASRSGLVMLLVLLVQWPLLLQAAEPLPSWRNGSAKHSIIEFMQAVTTQGSSNDVPPANDKARHAKTGKPYTEMIFQPMLEMLDYLRSQEFKTYIVSGANTAFIRTFAEEVRTHSMVSCWPLLATPPAG